MEAFLLKYLMAKQYPQKIFIIDVQLGSKYVTEDKVYQSESSKGLGSSPLSHEKIADKKNSLFQIL